MKTKNKCVRCESENFKEIENVKLCESCEKILFEAMLKKHIPKSVKSMFLKDR